MIMSYICQKYVCVMHSPLNQEICILKIKYHICYTSTSLIHSLYNVNGLEHSYVPTVPISQIVFMLTIAINRVEHVTYVRL